MNWKERITKEQVILSVMMLLIAAVAWKACEKSPHVAGNGEAVSQVAEVQATDSEEPSVEEEDSIGGKSLYDIRFGGWTDEDWADNDYLRELRAYFDAYNAGKFENEELADYKDVVKGKFFMGWIRPSLFGGVDIDFLFLDHPNYCFRASVYGDVDYETETVTDYEVRYVYCLGDDLDIFESAEEAHQYVIDNNYIAW